jgi:hypothetical protein
MVGVADVNASMPRLELCAQWVFCGAKKISPQRFCRLRQQTAHGV